MVNLVNRALRYFAFFAIALLAVNAVQPMSSGSVADAARFSGPLQPLADSATDRATGSKSARWGPLAVLDLGSRTIWPALGYSHERGIIQIRRNCVYYWVDGSRRLLLFNDVQGTWRRDAEAVRLHPWRGGHMGRPGRTVDLTDGTPVRLVAEKLASVKPTMTWAQRPHPSCDTSPVQIVYNARIEGWR